MLSFLKSLERVPLAFLFAKNGQGTFAFPFRKTGCERSLSVPFINVLFHTRYYSCKEEYSFLYHSCNYWCISSSFPYSGRHVPFLNVAFRVPTTFLKASRQVIPFPILFIKRVRNVCYYVPFLNIAFHLRFFAQTKRKSISPPFLYV